MRETVTVYVPDGYKDAAEFLRDCQFEPGIPGSASQPIETAPKTGKILAWWGDEWVITYWADRVGFSGWQPPAMMTIKVGDRTSWKPTHWQPLPAAPTLLA